MIAAIIVRPEPPDASWSKAMSAKMKRGKEIVAVTYEPYSKVSGDAIAKATKALAVDELTVSVWTCCTLHYPGRTVAVIISRASDPTPHITP